MPFKFDANGAVVLQEHNGAKLPVFVHPDGKEVPFDADSTLGTISRLNGEAKSHRERAEKAEGDLKKFDGITDPAAAKKAMETVANLDAKKLVDAGEIEKVKAEAIKAVEERFAPIVKERDTLKGQLDTHLIGGAFARSKFIAEKFAAEGPAGVEIAQALFAKNLKVEDGKVVAYGADGNKVFSRTRPGEPADAEEAIEILVDAYTHKAHILKASGANGGGKNPGGGGGGKKSLKDMTESERVQLYRTNPQEFERLKKEAA